MELEREDWGFTNYREAFERQLGYVDRRKAGEIGDTLIFTEHFSVYTIGVSKDASEHLVWEPDEIKNKGIVIEQTNRGGDITYHGIGQLVGYPIVDLSELRDLHAYLRYWEQVLIDTLAFFGLKARRWDSKTGVWIGNRKIAAMGIAVKHWITYHGFALNVNNDLSPFSGIVPCGIPTSEGGVTSMVEELGSDIDKGVVRDKIYQVALELPLK